MVQEIKQSKINANDELNLPPILIMPSILLYEINIVNVTQKPIESL